MTLLSQCVTGDDSSVTDPLQGLNAAFRAAYDESRQETLTRSGPIVLLLGDDLTLIHGESREQVSVSPAAYHQLKTISHAALGVYVLLAHQTDGEITPEVRERLANYRQQILAARGALPLYDFGPHGSERQEQILDASSGFLEEILDAAEYRSETLTAFTRRVEPWLSENTDEAARLQIDAIHAQMLAWRPQLSVEEWASLRAVVVGSQLPREGSLGVQYFARLFGESGEGRRVIYAESLFDEERAVRLAGTHVLDRQIAVAFYDDETHMHRDLLADATTRYLDEIFP